MGIPRWKKFLILFNISLYIFRVSKFLFYPMSYSPILFETKVSQIALGARLRRPLCPCDMFSKILHCVDLLFHQGYTSPEQISWSISGRQSLIASSPYAPVWKHRMFQPFPSDMNTAWGNLEMAAICCLLTHRINLTRRTTIMSHPRLFGAPWQYKTRLPLCWIPLIIPWSS